MKQSAIGEAPGRLDFMGGVADYSGSLVLQTPIRATTRVSVSRTGEKHLRLSSRGHGAWATALEPFCVLLNAATDGADDDSRRLSSCGRSGVASDQDGLDCLWQIRWSPGPG